MKEMSEFCKSLKLGRFKKKKNCKRLCATLHTIQSMLVHKNASNCSRMSPLQLVGNVFQIK